LFYLNVQEDHVKVQHLTSGFMADPNLADSYSRSLSFPLSRASSSL